MKNCYLIILIIGFLAACDQTEYNLTPSVTGYPMRAGMKWTYDRQVIIKKYESPASWNITDTDTINSEVLVWVDKDTVLNKKTVKVFKSKESDRKYPSVQFMLQDKKGLKTYANQNPGLNVFAQKGLNLKIATERELFNDTIKLLSSPTLDLKLPLLPDSSWICKDSTATDSLQIEKLVSGQETLTLTGMKINCYKLDWIYTKNSLYKGALKTEWLSEKGLMKSVTSYDRISFTDETGTLLYEGQYTETLTLKSFRYK